MKEILPIILLMIFALLAVGVYVMSQQGANFGGVNITHEYYSTTTNLMTKGEKHLIQSNTVTLGSVIVASTTPDNVITVYDATSTQAVTDGTYSTQVAKVNGATAGTYPFDTLLTNGLVVDLPSGYQGDTIITYRR